MDSSHNFFLAFDPPLRFHPVQTDGSTSLFYDESNSQVLVLKSDGELTIKSSEGCSEKDFSLKLPVSSSPEDVLSIKLSLDLTILAIQRTLYKLDFFNIVNGQVANDYCQPCRKGNILGFGWTSSEDIVFVTDQGLELYQVFKNKKQLKITRHVSVGVSWFLFSSRPSLLVTCSPASTALQFFQFTSGSILRLHKFDIGDDVQKKPLLERDVSICELYGQVCLVVLVHDKPSLDNPGTQVIVYTLQKDSPPQKSHILHLELNGRFAISVLDNLIVVHHQTSQTTLVFDIRLAGENHESNVTHHKSVVPPYSIRPVAIDGHPYEMYSPNWILFLPNIVIDATVGCLWHLQIDLNLICNMISSPALLVDFLLQRRDSKPNLLRICQEAVSGQIFTENGHLLGTISLLFNKFNQYLRRPAGLSDNVVTLDQSDMYSKVFSLFESRNLPDDYTIAVVFEYINSLVLNEVPILYSTYELLITMMVRSNRFYQLQQLIQYHVFTDSKPLACLLLSLHLKCDNCLQLALDMFKRLNMTRQDLIDVYLSVNSPSSAARALRSLQLQEGAEIPAAKFLESAMSTSDHKLFFVIYRLMQLRISRSKASAEDLRPFKDYLEKVFSCPSPFENSFDEQ